MGPRFRGDDELGEASGDTGARYGVYVWSDGADAVVPLD